MAESLVLHADEAATMLGFRTLSAFYNARTNGRIQLKPMPHGRGLYDRQAVLAEYRRLRGEPMTQGWDATFDERLEEMHV